MKLIIKDKYNVVINDFSRKVVVSKDVCFGGLKPQYPPATLPLSDDNKLIVRQGTEYKEVNKSELGGGGESQFFMIRGGSVNIAQGNRKYYKIRNWGGSYLGISEADFNNGNYRMYNIDVINIESLKLKELYWYKNHTASRGADLEVIIVAGNKNMTQVLARILDFSNVDEGVNKFVVESDIELQIGDYIGLFLHSPNDDSGLDVILGSVNVLLKFGK